MENKENQVYLESELKQSYMDYAMSVIISRALPDVRDGLKPVHRRVLYSMYSSNLLPSRSHRKSASVVGDVIKSYHPHGDAPIYEAMVRLAQPFAMRQILVEGQGNFGSIDGDPAASARYTEARLSKLSLALLEDLDKKTVDMNPNYDNSTEEPSVLPASYPNVLVNGANGIAVGMATMIPTHNLGETIDACFYLIDNPAADLQDIMQLLPAPDFPTGGTIINTAAMEQVYKKGRGPVIIRSVHNFETINNREAIVITEIPYQVNKAKLVEKISEVVNSKIIEGIYDLRDESNRKGIRIVIELKKDANPEVVLNLLYKHTSVQEVFSANMLAISQGYPKIMGLLDFLQEFLDFRRETLTRRYEYDLLKSRERGHILLGFIMSLDFIDEIITLIRSSKDPAEARRVLAEKEWPAKAYASLIRLVDGFILKSDFLKLSELQIKAILDLPLYRLTGLEREKITKELDVIEGNIQSFLEILGSKVRLDSIMKDELLRVKESHKAPRLTKLENIGGDIDLEELIQKEEIVITFSRDGYIKRVSLDNYRTQRRGGKGKSGMDVKDNDFIRELIITTTHHNLLFFSSKGKVYRLKGYELPLAGPQGKGRPLIGILPLQPEEKISIMMVVPESDVNKVVDKDKVSDVQVVFATKYGKIRRSELGEFIRVPTSGKIAIKLEEGDELIGVSTCSNDQDVLLTTSNGMAVRYNVENIRVFKGLSSVGVIGVNLAKNAEVISMSVLVSVDLSVEDREIYLTIIQKQKRGERVDELLAALGTDKFDRLKAAEQTILTVTERGFGKRTSSYEYRTLANRGGVGVKVMDSSKKTGLVISALPVEENDQLILITKHGQMIRLDVESIKLSGRVTQGVKLFDVPADDPVVAVAKIVEPEGKEDDY